jgi:hypothetical protein
MGRQAAGQKAYKALDLLTGVYDPEVRRALGRHGLDEAEVERGWQLLKAYAETRRAAEPAVNNEALMSLDAWENRWFVVCDAALEHALPECHAWLFNKLQRTSGFQVTLSVSAFIERVRKLEGGVRALGAQARVARERLRKRGLSDKVLQEGEALLKRSLALPSGAGQALRDPALEQAAETELWAWYLEWSGIARAVLTEKRLLNHIGFGRVGRPRKAARARVSKGHQEQGHEQQGHEQQGQQEKGPAV